MTSVERLARLTKPNGRTKAVRGSASLADGPVCPEPGRHGHTYRLGSRRLWCAVTQAIYAPAVFDDARDEWVCGDLLRPGVATGVLTPAKEA